MKDFRIITASEMLEEFIKNEKNKKTKQLYKALRTIVDFYKANSMGCSFDNHVDGSFDVVFQFCNCRK